MNAFEERAKLVSVHDAICRKGQPSNHDFEGCAIDAIHSVKDHAESLEKQVAVLSQVALEALRLVSKWPADDRCPDCGSEIDHWGVGALRDALTKALGPGYTRLVWGNDMNIDREAWDAALAKQAEAGK